LKYIINIWHENIKQVSIEWRFFETIFYVHFNIKFLLCVSSPNLVSKLAIEKSCHLCQVSQLFLFFMFSCSSFEQIIRGRVF